MTEDSRAPHRRSEARAQGCTLPHAPSVAPDRGLRVCAPQVLSFLAAPHTPGEGAEGEEVDSSSDDEYLGDDDEQQQEEEQEQEGGGLPSLGLGIVAERGGQTPLPFGRQRRAGGAEAAGVAAGGGQERMGCTPASVASLRPDDMQVSPMQVRVRQAPVLAPGPRCSPQSPRCRVCAQALIGLMLTPAPVPDDALARPLNFDE